MPKDASSVKVATPQRRRVAKGTRVLEAYARLRGEILDLTLAPGMLLDENEHVKRLKLSRTPIHEAFVRLAAEGLLIMQPNRQAQVAPLNLADLPRFIEAIDLLHRAVVNLAAKRRTDVDIAKMQAAADEFARAATPGSTLAATEANGQFHLAVAEASHNPYLSSQYERLLVQGLRMLRSPLVYSTLGAQELKQQVAEHREIIDAIVQRDAKASEKIAQRHWNNFVERYVKNLQENLTQDISISS